MGSLDYEAEYNNRARVPEHPQIFAAWARDAETYRRKATSASRAELGLRYSDGPRLTMDLFLSERGLHAPLALFVHGGYWRALEPSLFSHTAAGLNGRGVTVAVAGYDLCPQVSIATIIQQIRQACLTLWRRFTTRLLVYGHSAGAHLAAAMIATDWRAHDPAAPPDLVPAAYSLSGVFDLTPLIGISMNQDLRLDEAEARRVSPLFWPAPRDRILDVVVGGNESSEFLRQSRIIADTWGNGGTTTRYQEVAGANHFTLINPLTDAKSAMVDRLATLAAHSFSR